VTETDTVLAARWANLERLPTMIDHWYWRPGWRVGRRFYTWHLTFSTENPIRQLAAFYQDQIDLPFLDRVPLDGLHLTIQGLGFTDEITNSDVHLILAASRRRLHALSPFTLTFGPADADEQGVPLSVRPAGPVETMRRLLRESIADIWGPDRVPEPAEGFHPHVTVFYSNATADPSPLRHRLQDLRNTLPIPTPVTEISLIKLNRDHKVYEWETVATARLGDTQAPPQ
jgi:2'-5' RNA ligase